jgi:nucleotide-binding universal stress UspA family protein
VTPSSRRILVAVDSSLNARLALEHARRRAGAGGELIVAHVARSVPEPIAKVLAVGDAQLDLGRQLVDGPARAALSYAARRSCLELPGGA